MHCINLSGWSRLWVVISVIWALGVIGASLDQYYRPTPYKSSALVHWEKSKIDPSDVVWDETPKVGQIFDPDTYLKKVKELDALSQKQIDSLNHKATLRWESIAAYMLIPPLVGWILIITCWWAVSWVAAGFRKNSK